MYRGFKIYIKPENVKRVEVTDDLTLHFDTPGMEAYNAILVDRKDPLKEDFEIWPRKVNTETGEEVGSTGFMKIPTYLHDQLIKALKREGFTEYEAPERDSTAAGSC
ncbi:MAG: hypothetical protein GTN76_02795 [Candidatus Aenigmarchaeota archaeon]|nr:hypothetical protein [Candidatus Aenigmarchaeota archaeon]